MTETAHYLARLKWHPTDREVVVIEIPPELNQAIGSFEAARLVPELHGYAMHHNVIPSFFRWARFNEVHVVDERAHAGAGGGKRTLPVECSACGQPGRLHEPPTRCPGCGEPWRPVTPPGHTTTTHRATTACPSCGHAETGRFPFCSNCGGRMSHRALTAAKQHPMLSAPARRPAMDEPLPLGETVNVVTGEIITVTEEALPTS